MHNELYELGYGHGFGIGCITEDDTWTAQELAAYLRGYWAGVSDYARTLDM